MNKLERLNREIKRRTSAVTIFPDEVHCLNLISAFQMNNSEERQIGRK